MLAGFSAHGPRHLRLGLGQPAGQGIGEGQGRLRFRVPRVELDCPPASASMPRSAPGRSPDQATAKKRKNARVA